jgi:hypothetical protein
MSSLKGQSHGMDTFFVDLSNKKLVAFVFGFHNFGKLFPSSENPLPLSIFSIFYPSMDAGKLPDRDFEVNVFLLLFSGSKLPLQ